MALPPVIVKNTKTSSPEVFDRQMNTLIERTNALSVTLQKLGLSADEFNTTFEHINKKATKSLATRNKKTEIEIETEKLQKQLAILKAELELTSSAETRSAVTEIELKIKKLEKLDEKLDKKEAKKQKREDKIYLLKTKGIIGLLNPIGKGILEGGKGLLGAIEKNFDKNKDGITNAILGPFSLITSGIEHATGFDLIGTAKDKITSKFSGKDSRGSFSSKSSRMKSKSSRIDRGFGGGFEMPSRSTPLTERSSSRTSGLPSIIPENMKPAQDQLTTMVKIRPSIRDVAKTGDMGSLLIYNFLRKGKGKEKDEEDGGFLKNLIGGGKGISKILPMLLKGGAIAALVAGLIWAVVDGISGMGKFTSSKASSFIGGFLGGTGSGWGNAFKNAGKWALIGAGSGFLIGGPVGAIIGGLLGAAIGGIFGFFGGEKIAQGLDKLYAWASKYLDLKTIFEASPLGIMVTYVKDLFFIWKSNDKTVWQKIVETYKSAGKFVFNMLTQPLRNMINLVTGNYINKDLRKNTLIGIKNFVIGALQFVGRMFSSLFKKVTSSISGFFDRFVMKPIQKVFEFLGNIFGFIFSGKMNAADIVGSIFNENSRKNLMNSYTGYVASKQTGKINDGIVRSDGSFVEISPDDNVYATKKNISTNTVNNTTTTTNSKTDLQDALLSKLDEVVDAIKRMTITPIMSGANDINLDIFRI